MKLPIKKQYFDEIKEGIKIIEYRDAHITFICEETKEELRKEVSNVMLISKKFLDSEIRPMFIDNQIIAFKLK